MKKKTILFLLILFQVFSQSESAAPFLLISPNARSAGMGESGVAIAESPAMAMHYNVAGLAFLETDGNEYKKRAEFPLDFSYAQWLPKLKLDDVYYAYAANKLTLEEIGTFGASLRFLNYGTIQKRGQQNEDNGSYQAKEFSLNLGFATHITEKSSIGASLKYIYSGIVDEGTKVGAESLKGVTAPGHAFAFDFGYHTNLGDFGPFKNFYFGASITNLGPNISYVDNDQSDPLPTYSRIGMLTTLWDDDINLLRLSYDLGLNTVGKILFDDSFGNIIRRINHSLGAEYIFANTFTVRLGGFYEDSDFGGRQFLTAGLGFNADAFVIDLAYLIVAGEKEHPLDGTTRFSFSFYL